MNLNPSVPLPATPRRRLFSAFAVAIFVAAANLAIWVALHQPSHPADWHGDIGGFAFSAYQRDQKPLRGDVPSEAQIDSDLALLAGYTRRIRTYGTLGLESVPAIADKYGIEVMAGAWLDTRNGVNRQEVDALIASAKANRNITRVTVGNESVLRGDLTPEKLIAYLDRVRHELDIPVSTSEPWHIWMKYPELVKHVDFITVHLLPYWEGVSRRAAVRDVLTRYELLAKTYPKKRIVIGEVGWPSHGDRFENATASLENEALFIRRFLTRAQEEKLDYYLMEAFDQPWKETAEGRVGAYWGLFDADRRIKFPLTGPVQEDPAWKTKALLATLIAFLPVLWVVFRLSHLRLWGRVLFAALVQSGVAVLLWSFTLPFEFYLDWLDWSMLLVLVPAQLAMLAIVLINGFEFVEALAQKDWRRRFRPLPNLPRKPPKISLHVACCNEPPEMVIATLDSLAALDYPDFEVLVIDNNTREEAVWRPVEAHCARLGKRFRFFHLCPWPGFKAGALNFALERTCPDAAIVGVVDSDYVVRPDWLRAVAGYFDEPTVGVVQAPQAHRDYERNAFRRMTNWEYEGFFRIGMHHRNERDAIIEHGTMTLIRRDLLDKLRWSEWCICEDAELGLRVMGEGFHTVYVDEPFGRGVTPADFAAYKSQRFRWAFGAMQILRRHLPDLLSGHRYTAGQRYHFLTGWFSWFADALHLVFTATALAWTLGMLLAPGWFSLPHELFMVPVIGFFVVKVFFGLVLYRARVDCGWRDALAASVASMGLSHAIARGILRGLVFRSFAFTRTAKQRRLHKPPGAFAAVREETLLFVALMTGIAATSLVPGSDEIEAQLWCLILAAQSLPYAASIFCALVARLAGDKTPEPQPKTPAETRASGKAAVAEPTH